VNKRLLTYEREDGVQLSAILYLPHEYDEATPLPLLMWAYPREFTSTTAASEVRGSPYRFTTTRGASHLLLLTQGYAILDGPAMPIIGEGETANNSYVKQLVSSAKAAIETVVDMGITQNDRIAIGGHSYGAFMTANLLAHSDLFRAGIARSGAYNRTLTPFGFQNERRTFWEAPEIYGAMSPFFHADHVNEPILLIHGEIDNNSGTFPIQSERFYHALRGHGATVRYVTLPYESHGYAARESILHVVAEMLRWCDTNLPDTESQ
jgi:dipeptidyl aminopeptidase/acylaminoacyl peptidase